MVEFAETGGVRLPAPAEGTKTADTFAAVRERGMLNAGLDVLAQRFVEAHPDMAVRWEFYRPSQDNGTDQVQMREAMGWALADYDHLGDKTASAPKSGVIRRGDLVLMFAPKSVDNQQRMQDAVAAHADLKAPERAYKDSLDKNKVRLNDGTEDQAKGIGQIKVAEQLVTPRQTQDSEGGS